MNIIKQNPFRVLGLTGNASERELQKQIAIIKRYAEIGKTKSFDSDIKIIGKLNRNLDEIQHASNKIEQGHKRLLYSLFWFINHSQFDEIALNNLNGENYAKAAEIWNKVLKEEVTNNNFSAYHNLSTLYIAFATMNAKLGKNNLQNGILLKCTLIHSDHFKDIVSLVTGENLTICSDDLGKKFVDEIINLLNPYLNKIGGISTKELILLFDNSPTGIKKYIVAKFTEEPISNIENKVKKTAGERRSSPSRADRYGAMLYKSTQSDLALLEKILSSSNVQYRMIVNKLAEEILQCSIDFYNKFRGEDGAFDPGVDALRIAKYARSLEVTGQTENRVGENIDTIKEWVDDAPNREREKKITEDIASIEDRLKRFQELTNTIANAKMLVNSSKQNLENIRIEIGSQDDFYLQISSAVVNNALSMVIDVMNDAQSGIQYDQDKLTSLPRIVSSAISAMTFIELFDMNYETKKRFRTNQTIIKSINAQVQVRSLRQTESINAQAISNRQSNSSDGCYIATMAYGDYDHPQVMELRKFRDEKLANWIFGNSSIRFYYAISPHLVKRLKDQKGINRVIRILLDKIATKVQ